jgi:outer membrane receptor protein involved in Fe transport
MSHANGPRRARFLAVHLMTAATVGLFTVATYPALGATASADSTAGGIEEVVVTARKRSEDLQSVPLSITAFTAADLQSAGVEDLRDITFLTPGINFTSNGANAFSKPIIRGQTDIGGGENNVPVFFDGIYISNTSAIDLGLVDLERVEVIKGPVSATYGRSAYAGAINYISAKPTDQLRSFVEVTGGDYDKFNARASLSGPIVADWLKGGVSASYDTFNGTYHDDVTDQNANGYRKKDVLANFDITPTEHLEIRPVAYYGDDFYANPATEFGPANCSVGLGFGYSQSYCGQVPGPGFFGPYVAPPGEYGQTGNNRTVFLSDLTIALTYDWGMLSSLTGYDTIKSREYNEFDDQRYGTPTATYYLPSGAVVGGFPTGEQVLGGMPTGQTVDTPLHFGYFDRNRDFSEEFRYTSPQKQSLRWTLGGYYASSFHYEDLNVARGTCSVPAGEYIIDPFAVPCGEVNSPQHTLYTQLNKIYAGFAGIDWDVIDQVTLSTELRYTDTSASYKSDYAVFTPNPYGGLGFSTAIGSSPNPIGANALFASFHSVTSRESLKYQFTHDVQVYVSAANGEKAGGFNDNVAYQAYQPETNWTYEAGVKSQLLDHRVQINADVFYIVAKNYQLFAPPPGASLPGGFVTTNLGGLTTPGFELDTTWIVTRGFKLTGGLGYSDPKFDSTALDFGDAVLCSGIPSCAGRIVQVPLASNPALSNAAVKLDGLRPPYESNLTFSAAADFNYPITESINWLGRLDYRYEDKQYYQYPVDTGWMGSKNIVNLRTGLQSGPYSLIVWVRNLTDNKTPVSVADSAATGASNFEAGYFPVAVLPDGRTFGATFRYTFNK